MTPEEIKERRRQRILARSQQFKKQQQEEQTNLISQPIQSKQDTTQNPQISSFQRFQLSKKYQHNKNRLGYLGILLGFISAIIQYIFQDAFILFFIFAIGIFLNIVMLERMFGSLQSMAEQETLIKQLDQIKQLSIINKILKWRESLKPMFKYFGAYILTVIALGFLEPKKM